MAELVICGLDDLAGVVAERAPSHVISMLGDKDFPALAGTEHLKLRFHDIDQPQEGLLTPGEAAVRDLLDFAALWPGDRLLVIHCLLGVSRSPAAGLAVMCQRNLGREAACVDAMVQAAPGIRPNRAVLALADDVLGCEGRLMAAVKGVGTGEHTGLPGIFTVPV